MIHVRRTAEHPTLVFEVVVREGKGETRHHVTMSQEMLERLTAGKHTPERCLEAAFRFLLDREPKESILRRLCDGDLALFPWVRTGDTTLPFAILITVQDW
jgi:hypothetical protein